MSKRIQKATDDQRAQIVAWLEDMATSFYLAAEQEERLALADRFQLDGELVAMIARRLRTEWGTQ